MERHKRQQVGSGLLVRDEGQGGSGAKREISEQATMKVPAASAPETVRLPPEEPATAPVHRFMLPKVVQVTGVIILMVVESGLLVLSLVPATKAADFGWSATNGPFPVAAAPLVTAIFYLAPLLTGLLARRWEVALLAATFPAWFGIGVYSVASSSQNGIFSLTSGAHPSYLVGTLELFAALGGFGWLVRRAFFADIVLGH